MEQVRLNNAAFAWRLALLDALLLAQLLLTHHLCRLPQGLPSFEHDRAKTDRESTTMLSPWIHFGSISVRHIYYRVAQKHAEWQASGVDKGRSCLDFLQQMGYREYSR
jgi:deoxyribodipyrimidine photolyase